MANDVTAVQLPGGPTLYIRDECLEAGHGPLMPTPSHDIETCGMGDSYAHLYADGTISRYGSTIGTRSDLMIANAVPPICRLCGNGVRGRVDGCPRTICCFCCKAHRKRFTELSEESARSVDRAQ